MGWHSCAWARQPAPLCGLPCAKEGHHKYCEHSYITDGVRNGIGLYKLYRLAGWFGLGSAFFERAGFHQPTSLA